MGAFWRGWRDLDRILRGEATRSLGSRRGALPIRPIGLVTVLLVLAMAYGACMGSYAILRGTGPSPLQLAAAMLKVPALFFLTVLVTLPSLYVTNALVGSRLDFGTVVRLLAAIGVIVAPLASLGPIVAFFSVSTTSYPFMVLLNVAAFAVSGGLGIAFLLQTLHRLEEAGDDPAAKPGAIGPDDELPAVLAEGPPAREALADRRERGALEPEEGQVLGSATKLVFRCWMVLFALVGSQMGWVLRPFIGDPSRPFAAFRGRESSVFGGILRALLELGS